MQAQDDTAIKICSHREQDVEELKSIWNGTVATGGSFPETELLDDESAGAFFGRQSYVGVAFYDDSVAGLYILHPNNVGRCSHIANASYAVKPEFRGKGIGRALVKDSLVQAKEHGFRIMQFNAVLATNTVALNLYESLGFEKLGTIKDGFYLGDSKYVDIHPMYKNLV